MWIVFSYMQAHAKGQTRIVAVAGIGAARGDKLGEIRWFSRWRQYTFYPEPGTIFNHDCLKAIAGFCKAMHKERDSALERAGE